MDDCQTYDAQHWNEMTEENYIERMREGEKEMEKRGEIDMLVHPVIIT